MISILSFKYYFLAIFIMFSFSTIIIITNFLIVTSASTIPDEQLIIRLLNPSGSIVKGHTLQTEKGVEYFAFQDIPYAEPPVGKNRFKRPIYSKGWDETLDATKNVKICAQPFVDNGTEDCLVINVYTPQNPKERTELLPVMVWIHGGGFLFRSGSIKQYPATYFMEEEIIVVTFNYRLGILGFLSTEDEVIVGNFGLRDQQLGIEWTYNNIMVFGGDPDRITIAGQSAGAASVGWHLLNVNQRINKFFRGAILASGTAVCSFGSRPNARTDAFNFGYALNNKFNSNKSEDLLELLMNATTEELISKMDPSILGTPFLPVIEKGDVDFSNPQTDSMDHGKFVRVPMLMGFNSEEMMFMFGPLKNIIQIANLSTEDILSKLRFQMKDKQRMHVMASSLQKLYTNDSFAADLQAFMRFSSDMTFTSAIFRHVEDVNKYAPQISPYMYQFSYKPSFDPENVIPGMPGVSHAEDLKLLWSLSDEKLSETDRLISQRIVRIWANFIKELNPTPSPDPLLGNITWPVTNESKLLTYLDLNVQLKIMDNPRNYTYTRNILDQYLEKPITGF